MDQYNVDDVIPEFSDDEDILSPMTAETLVGLISEEDDAIALNSRTRSRNTPRTRPYGLKS